MRLLKTLVRAVVRVWAVALAMALILGVFTSCILLWEKHPVLAVPCYITFVGLIFGGIGYATEP